MASCCEAESDEELYNSFVEERTRKTGEERRRETGAWTTHAIPLGNTEARTN